MAPDASSRGVGRQMRQIISLRTYSNARGHRPYACFERNRTGGPNEQRKRGHIPTPWERFHEEHGDFYPPDYNRPPGGFSQKGPPRASYSA